MTTPEATSTTPNHHSKPERVNERAFTIAEVEALRARLYGLAPADGESPEDFSIRQQLNNEQEVGAYAVANGFNENHQKYNVLTTQLQDIVQIPEYNWYVGPRVYEVNALGAPLTDADGNAVYENAPSGQEKVWGLQSELFGSILPETEEAADVAEGEREQEFSLEDDRTLLDQRRASLAELSAKRQGRIAGKGGEAYAEAKELYDEQMILLARAELKSELEDNSISDDTKKIRVTEYLLEEQTKLRELTIDKLQNTPVGNFVKYMNRGKIATRIAKGLGLGLVAGVVGAGIGVAAGVAGVAAVGAGVATAATAAVRFARGFAHVDAKEGRGMQQLSGDQAQKDEIISSLDAAPTYIDTAHQQLSDKYEEDTKKEQGKRRKSVGAGVLGIVLGAGIAAGAHALIDAGAFDSFGNRNLNPPSGASPAPIETAPGDTNGGIDETPKVPTPSETPDVIKPSDTPDVADAIRDSFGGEGSPSGEWVPGGVGNYLTGDLGATELTPAGLDNFHQWVDGYSVRSGDSIWSISEDYLRAQGIANPSVYQIDAVKDTVLADFKARGLVGANGWLSAGQSLRVK
ncbi:hypothetical protein D3C73_20830 [compost metagenome]